MIKVIEYAGDICYGEKQTEMEKDCRNVWVRGCGGSRGTGFMWVHREGDTGAESHSGFQDLARGRQDVLGMFQES